MKIFTKFLSLLSGLLLFLNLVPASDASNIKSLDSVGEFSSCNILKSKYDILKLRLEITEKFGHFVPEIDQKLKDLEFKIERLYSSLKYHQESTEPNVPLEIGKEISTPAVVVAAPKSVPEEIVSPTEVQNVAAATTDGLYITDFDVTEEPKVCKTDANGNPVCSNLQLPTSCAGPKGLTCSSNKCRIQVNGSPSFIVSCHEDWTVIQRRINGSVDFNRDWSAYKNGFGDLDGEFWLGLDKIHALTKALAPAEILIQMTDFDGTEKNARYEFFAVGSEDEGYIMTGTDNYSGTAGESLIINRSERFTTYDRDNDKNGSVNCAQLLSGGWWFYQCDPGSTSSNLNGQYYDGDSASNIARKNGIKWKTFSGNDKSLKFVQMMIKKK